MTIYTYFAEEKLRLLSDWSKIRQLVRTGTLRVSQLQILFSFHRAALFLAVLSVVSILWSEANVCLRIGSRDRNRHFKELKRRKPRLEKDGIWVTRQAWFLELDNPEFQSMAMCRLKMQVFMDFSPKWELLQVASLESMAQKTSVGM